ncbi:hypothetical protein MW871_14940 [Flavobacterium sp. I-SCBP12n]|uniref:Uncharacterized protein n=1 Tax=Flavobacterium pygoscelis TaxID=2893176 RepID=A0A9X2BM29_9FLAO|nr:hypothetical protein [Flavobacterium pygoscelis]MCK8143184.1 hypothetical protein [Flavobacterium pygoscelis]
MQHKIKNTVAFQGLTPMQKGIYVRRKPMKEIEDHYREASNIGFEKWLQNHSPTTLIKNIILELTQDDTRI